VVEGSDVSSQRDYRKEHKDRIKRGLAKNLTRSQARGHARAGEKPLREQPKAKQQDNIENAVRAMNRGASLSSAAKQDGVSRERLARYVRENKIGKSDGRKWKMKDRRPRGVATLSKGKALIPTVLGFADASLAGSYWNDKSQFLKTNDIKFLTPYRGQGVTDSKGRFHPFETDPNEVLRLANASLPLFYEVYERTTS
jgi:hypothetical protein